LAAESKVAAAEMPVMMSLVMAVIDDVKDFKGWWSKSSTYKIPAV
jgi:hypothetical protein